MREVGGRGGRETEGRGGQQREEDSQTHATQFGPKPTSLKSAATLLP
jgi:hypothetical protein